MKNYLPKRTYNQIIETIADIDPQEFFNKKSPNRSVKFDLDKLLSFVIQVYYKGLSSEFKIENDELFEYGSFVPLNSKVMETYNSNYKLYLQYLVENNIFEKRNYSKGKHSNLYRLKQDYNEEQQTDLTEIELSNQVLKKIKTLNKSEWTAPAKKNCKHLYKWFNHKLTIDDENAIKAIDEIFILKPHKYKNKDKQPYLRTILNIKNQNFWGVYHRTGDKRLHTNLSNLPKFLKPFIRYDNQKLFAIDIKNSQPYFLLKALDNVIQYQINDPLNRNNHDYLIALSNTLQPLNFHTELLNLDRNSLEYKLLKAKLDLESNIQKGKPNNEVVYPTNKNKPYVKNEQITSFASYMFDISFESVDIQEFITYRDLVMEGEIYEHYSKYIEPDETKYYINKEGKKVPYFLRGIYNTEKNKMEYETYDDMREYAKTAMFTLFFGSHRNVSEVKSFEKAFPTINDLIKRIKRHRTYEDFSKLLQNIESECIISYVTKELARRYPDMPMFTIHDSISTTEEYFEILKTEGVDLIEKFVHFRPKVHEEAWFK